MILALIIYLMEHGPKRQFRVLNTFGKNPLFIYLLSGLIAKFMIMIKIGDTSLYGWTYANLFGWIPGKLGSFLFALMITTICWVVAKQLEKRSIIIKI